MARLPRYMTVGNVEIKDGRLSVPFGIKRWGWPVIMCQMLKRAKVEPWYAWPWVVIVALRVTTKMMLTGK